MEGGDECSCYTVTSPPGAGQNASTNTVAKAQIADNRIEAQANRSAEIIGEPWTTWQNAISRRAQKPFPQQLTRLGVLRCYAPHTEPASLDP